MGLGSESTHDSMGLHSCPHHKYRKATARMPIKEEAEGPQPQKAVVYFTIQSKQYLFCASSSANIFGILHIFNVLDPTIYLFFS